MGSNFWGILGGFCLFYFLGVGITYSLFAMWLTYPQIILAGILESIMVMSYLIRVAKKGF